MVISNIPTGSPPKVPTRGRKWLDRLAHVCMAYIAVYAGLSLIFG